MIKSCKDCEFKGMGTKTGGCPYDGQSPLEPPYPCVYGDSFNYFKEKSKAIIDSWLSADDKNIAISKLMTQMEKCYDIPIISDEKWNKSHKRIIELYNQIANLREL